MNDVIMTLYQPPVLQPQNKLTPLIRSYLQKLTDPDTVKKFPAFYGTRRFVTVFITAHHPSLSKSG
jgi:hypothetical protein